MIKNILMYDVGTGIFISSSGPGTDETLHNSTISASVGVEVGSSFSTSETVYDCSVHSISGVAASYNIDTSVLYPDFDYIASIATISGCAYEQPRLADISHGISNPLISTSDNSNYCPSIGIGYRKISNEISVTAERYGFNFVDSIVADTYMNFLFQKDNNIVLSDYKRDVAYAKLLYKSNATQYNYNYKQSIELTDVETKSAFPTDPDVITWPYDWDYVNIRTPEIKNVNYIVPRAVVDITEILIDVGLQDAFDLSNIKVKAYKNMHRRGITYDYDNSKPGNMIIWTIDNDHILYQRDMYTGENIDKYWLLPPVSPSGVNLFIKPSGLIPYGETSTGYKFMLERDINTVIEGIDEYGNFEWLPTDKSKTYEVYGITSYKDSLYVTANYTIGNDSQPMIIRYPSKGYYKDYIDTEPQKYYLSNSNKNPRDLSIYEDGTLLVSDNVPSSSGVHIHKYKFKYDYALRENYNNNYIRLYLREEYSDVSKQ